MVTPEASVLVLRLLTLRCWSQRRTAAPVEPIPTETAVKRLLLGRTTTVENGGRHLCGVTFLVRECLTEEPIVRHAIYQN
jgi:hypothetical protein